MVSNDTHCPDLEWYQEKHVTLHLLAYYVVTPLYFIFGLTGHLICLVAFYKQSKKEIAYRYQIFLVVSETCEVCVYCIMCSFLYLASGYQGHRGLEWFQSNFSLMWYTAHLVIVQSNIFWTLSLLLSVSMAADRVFAITAPFAYKKINHKRHQWSALGICILLAVSTSIFDYFRFYLEKKDGDIYVIVTDLVFMDSLQAKVLAHTRNVLRVIGLITMVVCNVTLVVTYKKRMRKVSQSQPSDTVDKKDKQQRTLTLLAIFQSLLNSISMLFMVCYYSAMYMVPEFSTCQRLIWAPIHDMVVQICDAADFYVVLSISKQFRSIIFRSIPCLDRMAQLMK